MLRVMTIVGTRPELIRLSLTIARLDQCCTHFLVHTGQNYDYELNQIFFEDLGIRQPNRFLEAAGATAAETIGKVIIAADRVLDELKPDAVLILGDTNSSLAAIPAKRRRIPVFHMEAGNRCFDQRVPEEINRVIVDHISDINLTYSTIARDMLLREGLPPDRVIKTGSPMFEILTHYRPKIDASDVLARLDLTPLSYFVVSAHREENIEADRNFFRLVDILNGIAERYGQPVIVSTHPRAKNRIVSAGAEFHPLVRLMKPLGFFDYVRLQLSARAVLSDSGTITEEASILNIPALNIREAHERPEGMEEAAVIMTGLNADRVTQGLEMLATQTRGANRTFRLVADYSAPNVSEKVARIILSYTDYVRQNVWREHPGA
ncbi:non-hydrolyzing UDP-N-acetylglucosamine 2-epimerase [Brevundimonas sp.]|uniref:non-hydrolyzing UDP-N-acetylglucosamine 2-epimerase n=1 Tax=Brevundimonas sp. TaxID=1871086 RepID=UPI00273791C7|nr:UDP-N-acetylglucosamine 2-epimerase (non-hydrolyzing) [Brevundimonas sp.]MDP3802982.1 UDP-N-acetylglucosamine 2-epimerase (non-hydrolyzing) [Brevundimonas sp.]